MVRRLGVRLAVLCFVIVPVASLAFHRQLKESLWSSSTISDPSRRDLLMAAAVSFSGVASPVNALEERNEALCGTGFYTNIWQYKCTDIGDISDEGVPKGLSADEEGTTNSLMSKLMSTESSSSETTQQDQKESTAEKRPSSDTTK